MTAFPETIPALLEARAASSPDLSWLFHEGDSWTLVDVAREVDRVAVGLAERGTVAGDRVALLAGNGPDALFAWLATNRLGAIAAPLNPALKRPELAAIFRLTRPRVIVVATEHRALAESACGDLDLAVRPTIALAGELAAAGQGAPRAQLAIFLRHCSRKN